MCFVEVLMPGTAATQMVQKELNQVEEAEEVSCEH